MGITKDFLRTQWIRRAISGTISGVFSVCCAVPAPAIDTLAEAYLEQGKRAYDRGDYCAAAKLFFKAASEAENIYNDKLYLASVYHNLGEALRKLHSIQSYHFCGEVYNPTTSALELAETYLKKALDIKEEMLGTNSLIVARSVENLASVYHDDNKLDEAEALLRKAIAIRDRKQGRGHCDCAADYMRLGDIASDDKRHSYKEAEEFYRRALVIWHRCLGSNDPVIGTCHQRLAFVHHRLNDLGQAEKQYDAAMRIFQTNPGASQKLAKYLREQLKDLVEDLYAEAVNEFQRARSSNYTDSRELIPALKKLGAASRRAGRETDAQWAESQIRKLTARGGSPATFQGKSAKQRNRIGRKP